MIENKMNICLACDNNYAKYAGVVLASILKNASNEDNFVFYILDGGISDENKQNIESLKSIKSCSMEFVSINNDLFSDYMRVKSHKYLSIASYYRLKLASLLPEVNKILYFDCDVVVNESLADLYNTEMGDYVVAGVHDIKKRKVRSNPQYVNSGVLLMDLDKIRKENLERDFLDYTLNNIDKIKCGDQEIINEVLKGRIKVLPDEWNVQSSNFTNRSSFTKHPKIIHFVAKRKPWHYASFSPHRDYYFKYLQYTPWKLSDEDYKHWTKDNQRDSIIAYLKYRPLFFIRPLFYKALYYSYIKDFLKNIFSIEEYNETHYILHIIFVKIKFAKPQYHQKKKQADFYYYKKNNIDITTIPPASGQIRDIQLANLALFQELDYVCRQNNLRYWLDAGTLIGAIRHKGFIPWDDDIDIGMPREDYEKVFDAFQKSSRNPDIFLDYSRSKKNPSLCILKVQHRTCPMLFVDIFPFDVYGKSMNTEAQLERTKEIKEIRKTRVEDAARNLSRQELLQLFDKTMKNEILQTGTVTDIEDTDYVWGIDFNHRWDNWFTNYHVIFPLKTIEFEGGQYYCLNNPEAFLKRVYGDYMAYPKKITFGHSMYKKLSEKDNNTIQNLIKDLKRNDG